MNRGKGKRHALTPPQMNDPRATKKSKNNEEQPSKSDAHHQSSQQAITPQTQPITCQPQINTHHPKTNIKTDIFEARYSLYRSNKDTRPLPDPISNSYLEDELLESNELGLKLVSSCDPKYIYRAFKEKTLKITKQHISTLEHKKWQSLDRLHHEIKRS